MAGAVNILIGLVLGLVFGTGWVVFREITDDRVRSGEDIMRLLRAPVALGLRRLPRPIRRFPGGAAARDLDRVVTHLYRTAGGGEDELPDRSLAVVSIGSDDATTALVIALATRLRDAGKAVLVADLGGGDDIARRLAERPEQVLTLPGDLPVCCVALAPLDTRVDLGLAGHGRTEAALRKKADLVLARASLQPAANAFQVAEWAGRAVVVVTAGRSVPATLRSDGQMLAAAGIDVDAVVVVGSDADDHSAPGRRRPTPSSRAPATGTPRATRPG
jgi:hypothetical protein